MDLSSCALHMTVIGTIASSGYGESLIQLAESAGRIGFGCVAVQVVGSSSNFPQLKHTRVKKLFDPNVLPNLHPQYCGAMRFAYDKRRVQLYKGMMWRQVLDAGFHLFSVDCDWRLERGRGNPAAAVLAVVPPMDVIALHDGPFYKQLNIGLVWLRNSPTTRALVYRVENRTHGAWDQSVFNEELNFNDAFRNLTCCHTLQLLCLFQHQSPSSATMPRGNGTTAPGTAAALPRHRPAASGPRPCLEVGASATPVAAAPPIGTRNRWNVNPVGKSAPAKSSSGGWSPRGMNTLHVSLRRLGRCTAPPAECHSWPGSIGKILALPHNLPAAVGSRCETP